MRQSLFIAVFFIPLLSICQEKNTDSASINKIVRNIDRLSEGNSRPYMKNKILNQKKIKERWVYFDNKRLSRIIIDYIIDSTAYTEKYYFKNKSLIYAYESEIFFSPPAGVDQGTKWAGDFYFSNGKLIDHVTLGHGRSELDDWDPEKEILQRLKKRKAELSLLLK
jgi:hypothetical protein